MEFRILGSLEAESGGGLVPLGWPADRKVLAALVLDAGLAVPARRLVDAVWGDDPPATAGKQVSNAVSRLRRLLDGAGAGGLIVTVAGGYRLDLDGCTVDARVFESRVAAADRAASEGRTAEAAGLLRSALDLWRGPALAGLSGLGLEAAAAAWDERRVAAQETLYGLELAVGRHRQVLRELAGLAASYPLRENLAGLHMVALYRCGRQADALAAYRGIRELLAGQLGLDPGPELQELHQQILTADPALIRQDTVPVAGPDAAGDSGSPPLATAGPAGMWPSAPHVRYALPADTAAFTGRSAELSSVITAVRDAARSGGVVTIAAIGGMPGVGKTALAVHAGHVLAGEFPDQQLFIDLHAHTPGHDPVRSADALAALLAAAGADARHLPGDLEGRAAMWRDQMAGKRALLVLDNAASSAQVAPLLPGGGCLVLVTSRRHLGDLPGAVAPVLVDILPPSEAEEMFIRLTPRAAGERDGVAEVVALAGFLPLAVSLLARVLARHPSWTLDNLASETRARVLTLTAEHSSVAAAFEVSYRYLDPGTRWFFRLLGMHPGVTSDAWAAAALADTSPDQAAGYLEALHGEGLLTETGYRRYGMHDLIRRYARDLVTADPGGGQQALSRLLDYYQHAAANAEALLARQSRTSSAIPTPPPAEIPDLADHDQALAWARTERGNLLACLDHVTRTGQHPRVIALTAGIATLLRLDGPWADAISRHDASVQAARRLGDQRGEASALTELGVIRLLAGSYPDSTEALEAALDIYRDLGDRLGEGNALRNLGTIGRMTGDYPGAVGATEAALVIYRDLGDRHGQADALRDLAGVRERTGDYPDAAGATEEALVIFRDLGDRHGQGSALRQLAEVRERTGDYADATEALREALGIYRDLGHRVGQAAALVRLGSVRRQTGDYPDAAEALKEALGIFRDVDNQVGQAAALVDLGSVLRMTGDYPGAARALDEGLGIFRDLGHRRDEADALNEVGTLHLVRGDPDQAEACHWQALNLARQIGSSWEEASALAGLGRCALAAGNNASGRASLRQAQQIFHRIGAAETSVIAAELCALTQGPG